MKIMFPCGVRPDLVAMSTTIEKLNEWLGNDFNFVWTSQHFDYNMSQIFFEQLGITKPKYSLNINSGSNNWQTGRIMIEMDKLMNIDRPDLLISFSDANACQAAIAATKLCIKVAHFEAGMRSWDWRMPEEKNRRIVDSISDYFFAPNDFAAGNLIFESHRECDISIVNKQIIDVIEKFKDKINRDDILDKLGTNGREYMLVELHRPENTENKENMANILKGIKEIYDKYGLLMIAPLHKRTQNALEKFGLTDFANKYLKIVDSIGFFEFEKLTKNAFCCLSDSGTLQETSCWYGVPCVTVRPSTERVEAIVCGSSILAGESDGTFNPISLLRCVEEMERRGRNWQIPYETGATDKIINILKDKEDDILKTKVMMNDI